MNVIKIACLVALVMACTQADEKDSTVVPITNMFDVSEPWTRPATSGTNGAAYFILENGLSKADTLINIYSSIAGGVQIHESFVAEDGLAGMRHKGTVEIPSGHKVSLEPGGVHVMLLQLKQDLAVGDSISLELEFKTQGIKKVTVPVKVNS